MNRQAKFSRNEKKYLQSKLSSLNMKSYKITLNNKKKVNFLSFSRAAILDLSKHTKDGQVDKDDEINLKYQKRREKNINRISENKKCPCILCLSVNRNSFNRQRRIGSTFGSVPFFVQCPLFPLLKKIN